MYASAACTSVFERSAGGSLHTIVFFRFYEGGRPMMIDIDKAIITDIYQTAPTDKYPGRLYCSLLTDDSNMRVSVIGGTEEKLRSVSLTPVSIQAKLLCRKIGTGQVLELHNPVIRVRGVSPQPQVEKSQP